MDSTKSRSLFLASISFSVPLVIDAITVEIIYLRMPLLGFMSVSGKRYESEQFRLDK